MTSKTFTVKQAKLGYADRVYCTDCNGDTLVRVGAAICPKCLNEGTLSWVDGEGVPTVEEQEIQTDELVAWVAEEFNDKY